MYFPHTGTSWDKYMFNGNQNWNFKIGVCLFGWAEKILNKAHIVQWILEALKKWRVNHLPIHTFTSDKILSIYWLCLFSPDIQLMLCHYIEGSKSGSGVNLLLIPLMDTAAITCSLLEISTFNNKRVHSSDSAWCAQSKGLDGFDLGTQLTYLRMLDRMGGHPVVQWSKMISGALFPLRGRGIFCL